MEWARDRDGKEADLEYLLDFLRKKIMPRERSEIFKVFAPSSGNLFTACVPGHAKVNTVLQTAKVRMLG
jgi:hypothetical protein